MKASVDDDSCRGHSLCCTICPEVFTLNRYGYAEVHVDEIPAEFEAAVKEAALNCPERAITLS